MRTDALSAHSTIAQALEANPAAAARLISRRTACVGCYMARFCTLRDTASYYGFALDPFIAELEQARTDIIVAPGGTNA